MPDDLNVVPDDSIAANVSQNLQNHSALIIKSKIKSKHTAQKKTPREIARKLSRIFSDLTFIRKTTASVQLQIGYP